MFQAAWHALICRRSATYAPPALSGAPQASPPPEVVSSPPPVAASPPPPVAASPPPAPAAPSLPPSEVGFGRNAATWLRVAPLLNTSRAVFDAAGLLPKLADNALVATLFFPTDDAWTDFLAAAALSLEELVANGLLCEKLARNAIVPHVALRTLDFESGGKLATLAQEALTLRPTADVFVVVSARTTATIVVPDLVSNESILHIVDSVLVPDSVRVTV